MDMSSVKLRSNTSTIVGDRVYYIVKKFPDGKASTLYSAYDYPSGILVYWNSSKKVLIEWLNDNAQKIEDKFLEVNEHGQKEEKKKSI